MPDITLYECQNCGARWSEDQLNILEDTHERVAPGEPMPAGECPECCAVCHEVEEADDQTVGQQLNAKYQQAMSLLLEISANDAVFNNWIKRYDLPRSFDEIVHELLGAVEFKETL
jgi:hypothetical protein